VLGRQRPAPTIPESKKSVTLRYKRRDNLYDMRNKLTVKTERNRVTECDKQHCCLTAQMQYDKSNAHKTGCRPNDSWSCLRTSTKRYHNCAFLFFFLRKSCSSVVHYLTCTETRVQRNKSNDNDNETHYRRYMLQSYRVHYSHLFGSTDR